MNNPDKILIVDDDRSSLSVLVRLLDPHYQLAVAKGGVDALELASGDSPPDLILLDVIMPDMDGYETCRRLKADPRTAHIPVIFLTVKSEVESETHGLELGAVDYITKPVNPPILLARVRTHLTLYRIQLDLEAQVRARTADLMQREGELVRARDQAEAANRAKGAFLSVMSHEMRTPLNAVAGMNQLLERTPINEVQRRYLDLQAQGIRGLLAVIEDVLTISDMDSGGHPGQERETFDLRTLLQTILDVFGQEAAQKGVQLETTLDPGVEPLRKGPPSRVRQILLALVGNAVKFTDHGQVQVEVRGGEEGRLRFTVKDTGIGIPQEHRERIFEAFTQVDASPTRRHGGRGLGLTIARRLAEAIGGEIRCESEVGRGTRFELVAPLPVPPAGQG